MIEEWYRSDPKNGVYSDEYIQRLRLFLEENSDVEFSSEDVEFLFLDLIGDSEYTIECVLDSFLSNEKRVSNLIRVIEDNGSVELRWRVINSISWGIYKDKIRNDISLFLFRNFPITFFNKNNFQISRHVFYFLCYIYQEKEIDYDIGNFFNWILSISPLSFIDIVKRYFYDGKYLTSLTVLNRYDAFRKLTDSYRCYLLEKVSSLIKKKNTRAIIKSIENMLKSISVAGVIEFHLSTIVRKEIYTRFILKKFVLPKIS